MAPLDPVQGAVVSLMDRTNVETVIVAGKVRKWKGELLNVNLVQLRKRLGDSRDLSSPWRASRRTFSATIGAVDIKSDAGTDLPPIAVTSAIGT